MTDVAGLISHLKQDYEPFLTLQSLGKRDVTALVRVSVYVYYSSNLGVRTVCR